MIEFEYTTQSEKYEYMEKQHGGYWRHEFTDHAYLYNLYFPPEAVLAGFRDQIHDLVLNYPVAQNDLAGLVGELTDQPPERLAVGNGASELIKIVSGQLARRLIVPVPSFNEYVNAAAAGKVVEFALESPSFELDVDKFAQAAFDCQADVAVVVTPNNPTSLLVPKSDLIRLAQKLESQDCMLIVDESFIDFARDRDQVTLEGEIDQYPNLAILKSMSKAYGICGIRIGYMLSDNREFVAAVRQAIPIWNINGFAESFLRIVPQYRQEFVESCRQVRADRDELYKNLCSIPGMTVYQPDANFIFCRLPEQGAPGPEVSRRLFIEHNIYIKHCRGKTLPDSDRYIRIASRTQAENHKFVEALKSVIDLEIVEIP